MLPDDTKVVMPKSKLPNSRDSVPVADKNSRSQIPLVKSPEAAKHEIEKLRRGREDMESAPTEADTSIRSSVD